MNSYEDDLRETLKADFESGELREVGESDTVFGALSKAYPANGSKIDWAKVPDSIERIEEDESSQPESFAEFFDEMRLKFCLSGTVLYAGDSATDFALEGSVDAIRRILPKLLEVPQHHYFIGIGYSWCICLTMEGDMAFGLSPRRLG